MNAHPTCLNDEQLLAQCRIDRGRRGGPGGQHRNKVETHVMLTHTNTGITAQAGERRSQGANKRVALRRLRLQLAMDVRHEPAERPSELWRHRCRGGRVTCNPQHRDFPVLLAEALDAIEADGLDAKTAAIRLGCSSSQLIKLIKKHPPAMTRWNTTRASAGLRPLR